MKTFLYIICTALNLTFVLTILVFVVNRIPNVPNSDICVTGLSVAALIILVKIEKLYRPRLKPHTVAKETVHY